MKFILLESRGGDYLVVAENVAWLRSAENGQTNVGIVGGQPLLVVGSIEEVAAKILAASGPEDELTLEPVPIAPAVESPALPEPVREQASEAVPEAVPKALPEAAREVVTEAIREPVIERVPKPSPPERSPRKPEQSLSLAERVARASGPAVKAGTQRFMTMSE